MEKIFFSPPCTLKSEMGRRGQEEKEEREKWWEREGGQRGMMEFSFVVQDRKER